MTLLKINLNEIEKHISKSFILEVKDIYNQNILKNIDKINNKDFFSNSGNYFDRNSYTNTILESDYFQNLLFPPNIAMIDYIIKNIDFFRDKNFLNFGSGIGILSVFLQSLGVNSIDYDNLNQLGDSSKKIIDKFNEEINNKFNLNVKLYTDLNNMPSKMEIVFCSGIWLDSMPKNLFKTEQQLLFCIDSNHDNKSKELNRENFSFNESKANYEGLIKIYESRKI